MHTFSPYYIIGLQLHLSVVIKIKNYSAEPNSFIIIYFKINIYAILDVDLQIVLCSV